MTRNTDMLLRGVTGIALTAGAVAMGVALANKNRRKAIGRGAKKVISTLSQMSEGNGQRGFQAVAHKIGITKRGKKSRGGRKAGMMQMGAIAHKIGLSKGSKRGRKSTSSK